MSKINDLERIQECLDDYMMRTGKHEINEIEANSALQRAGVLNDEAAHPGKPLRDFLMWLRDNNYLPQNIMQRYGLWKIRLSSTIAKFPLVLQF